MSDRQPPRADRARFTRLLQLGLISLTLVQGGAAARALTLPAAIAPVIHVPSVLDAIMGIVWGVVFAACAWVLRQSSRVRRRIALAVIGAYTGYALLRLIVFAQADYDQERLLFLLIMSVLILLLLLAAVYGERQ